jgi:hypothetical protein
MAGGNSDRQCEARNLAGAAVAEVEATTHALRCEIAGLIQANADLQAEVAHQKSLVAMMVEIHAGEEKIIDELDADLPPGTPLVPALPPTVARA